MNTNQIDSQGRKWIRCRSCGDSQKNKYKSHCLIDSSGRTYCFRCGESTQLDVAQLIDIALENKSIEEVIEEQLENYNINDNVIEHRFTLLPLFQSEDYPKADIFEMRNHLGERIGWHIRNLDKRCKEEGIKGIGYLADSLTSTPDRSLVLVEGEYDVIKEHYVCMFGKIFASNLRKFFRLQFVWLFPDPDVTDSTLKRQRFYNKVIVPALDNFVFIQGVIISDDDPKYDRNLQYIPLEQIEKEWI